MDEIKMLQFYVRQWALERRREARADERGEVVQTVILIAVFAALAIAVGAIIFNKVTKKANGIPMG